MKSVDDLTTLDQSESTSAMSRTFDFVELMKPRLTILSVLTTLAGYYIGARGQVDLGLLVHLLGGTFLVGGGCGTINMVIEREQDAQMKRTLKRPLPAGRLTVNDALIWGIVSTVIGLLWLGLTTPPLTTFLAALTFITYVFLYTPLKRRTTLNTIVGAIPGALPPLIGWSAATSGLDSGALALGALLFFWQMPHFLALAWMYRKDYARAGFRMLPSIDPLGETTSRQMVLYVAALIPVSMIPTLVGISGKFYLFGALFLGVLFLVLCVRFAIARSGSTARTVFHFSLIYLPALLICMIIDEPTF